MKTIQKLILGILIMFGVNIEAQSWSALGSGMNGYVNALTVYNGNLIAGGSFTTAGGNAANNIAEWNGTSWSALGSGMGGDKSFRRSLNRL
ncbi:MAG: hypothetical protein ACLQQ4_18515 [Bacteroidia bacterium]